MSTTWFFGKWYSRSFEQLEKGVKFHFGNYQKERKQENPHLKWVKANKIELRKQAVGTVGEVIASSTNPLLSMNLKKQDTFWELLTYIITQVPILITRVW